MPELKWVGAPPKPPLSVELQKAGWQPSKTGAITVSRVLEAQVRPWLWLADRVSHDDAQRAVALGAYDAVTPGELLKRLTELRVPAPPVNVPKGFIAKSAAARRVLE